MKRRYLLTCCLFLAACGLGFASGKSDPVQPEQKGKTTIIYYLWDDPSLKPIVDAYNASQDKVFVDARYIPATDYETKITTLLTAKAEMDCFNEKRQFDMFTHYENGFIEPLDNFLKTSSIDKTAIDTYRSSITIDGKIVAFPWRGASYYTYYNRKLFEKAGIPTPDVYVKQGSWTWEKFAETAKKLSSGDGTVYGASVYFWGNNQLLMESQKQKPVISGNGTIDYDGAIYRWYKMRKDLEAEKALYPLIDMKVTKTHYSKQFYDGNVAMLLIGEWFPGYMQSGRDKNLLKGYSWNDWGVTRLPCDEKNYVTMGTPTVNHITSYSKNKQAAFDFIAWMGGPGGAKICAQAGVLPATVTPAVKDVLAKQFPDLESLAWFTEPKTIYPMLMTKYGSRLDELSASFAENYLLNKVTDTNFDSTFRKSLKDIIDTTN